jgi:uncharacterized protein YhhL (DUF1145 family)
MPKVVLGLVWIWALASFFVAPESSASSVGRIVFWVLVVAHAIECVVFLPKFRRAGGSLPGHFAQTMIFGFLHASSLESPETSADG